jgi:PhzF family phenazine biosynthesis protein
MRRPFTQVDVFAQGALSGNPLAVVHDAQGLADDTLRAFGRWTNLSETTFLLPPTDARADYRVRIFSPGGELRFAGHPTLGSCHAWLERGGVPQRAGEVVQQCEVGLVRIRLADGRAAFEAPPMRRSDVDPALLDRVLAALGVDRTVLLRAQWLDNGLKWLALQLDSAATVLALEPDHAAMKGLVETGVVGRHGPGGDADVEVRAFIACVDVPEDPVTGSLNASLAQWLIGDGVLPASYVAAQGTRLQRAGRVHLQRDGQAIWVGGRSVTVVRGEVLL